MTAPSTPAHLARLLAERAHAACAAMARATAAQKNGALVAIANSLESDTRVRAHVLAANAQDVTAARAAGLDAALIDRLVLDDKRLTALAGAVRAIAALPDPVGAIEDITTQPSGIQVGRMRVPLGTILMVFESRPNVTVDAAALCLKSGNAVILRGGKESALSNAALADIVRAALAHAGLPADAALLVDTPEREVLYALLKESALIDLAIPRGGTSLIDAVNEHARVPVIQHYQGICHVYVHAAADVTTATNIAVNAKVSRPGVCNAMECLVVDAAIAGAFLPGAAAALTASGVELRGDDRARAIVPGMHEAGARDFDTEFLSLVCAVKIVDGLDDALAFVRAHGSRHTESIVTNDHNSAMRFVREVDASCVMVNASTRFNDGGELGLGAELGISTTKLHAYGPMGLTELTTRKWIVLGHGETRGSPP